MKTIIIIFSSLILLLGCGQSGEQENVVASQPAAATEQEQLSIYEAAITNPARSEADRKRDAGRKPAEVLEFFGVERDMRVLDMFSGGGYYSEILSYVVGPAGNITAHSNESYAAYVGDEAITRYANERLENVEIMMAENNELKLAPRQYDAVLLILSFHDIFYSDPEDGWPKIDGEKLLAELHHSLKPGAVLGIVDHYAEAGSASETGNTLHRIDPAIVIADMEAAGFVLDARSEILRNPEDDHSLNVFDPAITGKTDRFVMRFLRSD